MAGGKTAVMRGIVSSLEAQYGKLNSLIVTPFTNLKEQVKQTFNEIGLSITAETYMEAVLKGPRIFDLLFLDEAHHVGSEYWGKVPYLARARAIIGLSGTPFRLDKEPLLSKNGGIFSHIINGPDWDDVTQQKYLANLRYFAYPLKKIVTKVQKGTYIPRWEDQETFEIDNREYNIVKEYQDNFAGQSAIAFCKSYQHSIEIAGKFNAAGIRADYMSCYRKKFENESIKNDMKDGDLKVICAVNMGSEGMDIPRIKLAIMAREIINSETLYLQQVGRTIRPFQNEIASVLDLVGNVYRFSHPKRLLKEKVIV